MDRPFGPQLIGETEKTLNALLRRHLAGTGLDEPRWVTLRIASQFDGAAGGAGALVTAVAGRAHLDGAQGLVEDLTRRGLLDDGRLTAAGRELVSTVQAAIAEETGPIWNGLPADDVAAATRALNQVRERVGALLA